MSKLTIPVSASDHIQGEENAPLTLVEYGDYECPYCGLAYPIVKQIQQHFGKELKLVFRNFPLTQSHPHAEIAAMTAEFSATKQKFWEMHDLLYENQQNLEISDLFTYASYLDLPAQELEDALEQQIFLEKIKNDFLGGVRSGVNGTPTFFINGTRHNGSFDFETLLAALNDAKKASPFMDK